MFFISFQMRRSWQVLSFVFFIYLSCDNTGSIPFNEEEDVNPSEPSEDSSDDNNNSDDESNDEEPMTDENDSSDNQDNEEGDNQTETETPTPSDIIPLTEEHWLIIYSGYGSILFDEEEGIVMEPMTSTTSLETHSALILANTTLESPVQDFTLRIEAVTEEQLRPENPNPWEVFWIFFNYIPDGENKMTNYFILKTNGIELGRAFDELGQAFLFTADSPQLAVGASNTFVMEKTNGNVTVTIDGIEVIHYESTAFPDSLYDHAGAVGLYTEDARVRILSVQLE